MKIMPNLEKKTQPSDSEKREFWEWCEFKFIKDGYGWGQDSWLSPLGDTLLKLPNLDLNNLFKYAVPKLKDNYQYELIGWNEGQHRAVINKFQKGWAETYTIAMDKDPALALFWAIWEVIQ